MEIMCSEKPDIQKSFIIVFTFNVFSYWFIYIQFVLSVLGLFIYLWCLFFSLMRIRISIRILILFRKLCETATTLVFRHSKAPFLSLHGAMALHSSIWASKLLNVDFNSDPDPVPAFLSNAYPGQDPASRNNSDSRGYGYATLTRIIQDYVPCTWLISVPRRLYFPALQ